ncbi:cell filamentation protein Fic [Enterovibrio norvegicus FF-33]|uniref:protein adenylyltransferase n=1 Tax=Enterovibrio norvegicus FF-454 TaxID=1185651 RepID=A0A1E5CB93_9GAMM|nr:Fic family protein [Enterovibrio norvegicus]OEE62786.1 cell filamentation protein Fic [Enterovibrio norvegicus FF-454]OEE70040.1 cell filamentation protein Fic [Enterovibrio norvegicus FF-33]OEE90284.1 cell filamentation protein Fic [Enterovibrio norvegicus FF-162]
MRDKYGVAQDKYCYADSDVLINLLNIRDFDDLAEAESEFTAERYRTYQSKKKPIERFDLAHLIHLHYHLFQDVYKWAGQLRDVDISKGNTRFCTFTRIVPEANKLFIKIPSLQTITHREQLIDAVADLFCELNLLHPFREGNGRTLRFFFEEMLFDIGYDITWPEINQQQWIKANIAGVHLDLAPLKGIFNQAIPNR